MTKLTKKQLADINRLLTLGLGQQAIAEKHGVTRHIVKHCSERLRKAQKESKANG